MGFYKEMHIDKIRESSTVTLSTHFWYEEAIKHCHFGDKMTYVHILMNWDYAQLGLAQLAIWLPTLPTVASNLLLMFFASVRTKRGVCDSSDVSTSLLVVPEMMSKYGANSPIHMSFTTEIRRFLENYWSFSELTLHCCVSFLPASYSHWSKEASWQPYYSNFRNQ